MVQNPFRYGVKISMNLEVDFDRNLAPTWAPTWGAKKVHRFDFLEFNIAQNPSWGHLGPQGPLGSIFDRFLIDFLPIFDRSWTLNPKPYTLNPTP